jgi:hypothetical protein
MVTAGEIIFGKPKSAWNVAAKAWDIAKAKYSDKPISAVLQNALGGPETPIRWVGEQCWSWWVVKQVNSHK